ncbi:MAG: phosphoribosylformylglycinamidine synthase subunit PurS [Saprospiraceae bacterium]|nr:phosphoribosylformylglycinamidine synthase subunit PurS [Saprospiraceae bacterium]
MKKFQIHIDIMPHKELLDPQGKTVTLNISHMDIQGVEDVRIGKHIQMTVNASDEASASQIAENSCKKLLANLITETYSYQITEI